MQLLEEIAKKDPHLSKLLLSPKSIHESAFKTEKIASRTNRDIKILLKMLAIISTSPPFTNLIIMLPRLESK